MLGVQLQTDIQISESVPYSSPNFEEFIRMDIRNQCFKMRFGTRIDALSHKYAPRRNRKCRVYKKLMYFDRGVRFFTKAYTFKALVFSVYALFAFFFEGNK